MKEHIPQQKHEAKGDQSVFKMRGSSPDEPLPRVYMHTFISGSRF